MCLKAPSKKWAKGLNMKLSKNFIEFLQSSKLVKITENGDLRIVKYAREVFFNNLWDDYLEYCRGLVFDKDFNIISLPFTKIYNYGIEENSPVVEDGKELVAFKKFNGFMVAVTAYNSKPLVSTTGSLTSSYVELAESLITPRINEEILTNPNYTYLFECIHESDPHIIEELDKGLICVGRRAKELGSKIEFSDEYLHPSVAASKLVCSISELKALVKVTKHEGFVFYWNDSNSQFASKIKTPIYLITKFLARTKKSFDKNSLSKYLFDEEYYGLIDYLLGFEGFFSLAERERIKVIRNYFWTV